MEIPNERKVQQIAINHSPDIDFIDFMNFQKKCTTKPYCLLVNDTTLPLDTSFPFRHNLLEII